MALTDIVARIHSVSDDVGLLLKHASHSDKDAFKILRYKLRNLTTFVLSARSFSSDGNLRSFLARVEDVIRRYAGQIHDGCLHLNDLFFFHLHPSMLHEFRNDIKSLKGEIDEWYVTMLNYCSQRSTTCITDHQVLEIITAFLENLIDFRSLIQWPDEVQVLISTIEAFEQQVSFMKSFICFASNRSVVEPLKDVTAYTETVIVSASHLLFQFDASFHDSEVCDQLQSDVSVLLHMINPVDSHVFDAYTQVLSSSKSQTWLLDDGALTAMKDFLDSLISSLWDLLRLNTCSVSVIDLQELYAGLRYLRTIFKQHLQIKEDIGDVLCDAAELVGSLHHTHIEVDIMLDNLLDSVRGILVRIEAVGESQVDQSYKNVEYADVPAGNEGEGQELGVEVVTESYRTHMASQGEGSTSATNEQAVVGFHDDESLILDQLTRGSRKLQIVAIVGMPGLGKTTLATRVYNDRSVLRYFFIRAWSPVSQVLHKRKVVLDLLNQIDPSKCSQTSSENDLAEILRKSLKGRRYLVFLDDVWDIEAWNNLEASFPDDNVGSRIILTSRRHNVAPYDLMVDQRPYFLRQLNEEESLELLQRKLSSGLSLDLGMKIAEKCKGLPLIIVIVAGVLKTIEPESWNGVLEGLRNVTSTNMQCRNTLELSYSHLPAYLRPCLLYLGAFREDEEVSAMRLLRLWIAEGFVQRDVAEEYLEDLIDRSLLMVVKQRSIGGPKTCRIHDLLRDFCIQKAKDEHFFQFLNGHDELSAYNEQHGLQRLCIHSEAEHFKQSKLFCPGARSLIFNLSQSQSAQYSNMRWFDISSTIQIFKLLKVLDLEQVDLGNRFPTELEQLVQLAFLAIHCNVKEVPSLIGNLLNLQTFILQCGGLDPAIFPESIWNLQKLQCLYIKNPHFFVIGLFPFEGSSTLHEMERLSGATIPHSEMEGFLRKIPNIRKLKFLLTCPGYEDDCRNIVVPDILSQLESLQIVYYIHWTAPEKYIFDEFSLPAHLKKLTLRSFKLSWRNLSTIGALPNLEILKLLLVEIEEETWEMKVGEFPKLRILKLRRSELVRWITDCDDLLYCFQKLVLVECLRLEEMPSCLGYIPTLEVIEVSSCYDRMVELVKQIEETRKELMGDSGLKIITSHIFGVNDTSSPS